jgi:hypothetical protein
MKLIVIYTAYFVLAALSMLQGCIHYLWRFSKKDFRIGTSFINTKIINFDKWVEN